MKIKKVGKEIWELNTKINPKYKYNDRVKLKSIFLYKNRILFETTRLTYNINAYLMMLIQFPQLIYLKKEKWDNMVNREDWMLLDVNGDDDFTYSKSLKTEKKKTKNSIETMLMIKK